jgi:hypothetical protein
MTRPPVDFRKLKSITLEQAIGFLPELKLHKREGDQLRYPCPACGGDNKRALSVNVESGFRCFAGSKSGTDATALVAHVRGISNYEAGRLLEEHFFSARAEQPSRKPEEPTDVASMLGISPDALDALGGYEAERLVIPLRKADGTQIGTLGIATRADQSPLLAFDFDEKALVAEKPAPDDLRKLFRVVNQ